MKNHLSLCNSIVKLFGLCLVFSVLQACKGKVEPKPMSANLNNFIYAYTSGTISKSSSLRVRFNQVVEGVEKNDEAESGLIKFSPSINGKAYWEDERTLLFQPEDRLPSNTQYLATVNMTQLFPDVPSDATSFEFAFQTAELFFDVLVDGMQAVSPNDLSQQQLKGRLRFSDVVEEKNMTELLTATQNGKALPVNWSNSSDQTNFEFVVSNINRGNNEGQISLQWNGKPIGIKKKGNKEVVIPSLSDFKIMEARVTQGSDQSIVLQFSDPLLKNQTLKGLVSISGYNGNLRYDINGNQLMVYPATRLTGQRTVKVARGIQNSNKAKMQELSEWAITLENVKPQLRLVGNGVIIPEGDGLVFPFEAVSLNAVEVEVFKIFDNNILQFLQTNQIDGQYNLERVGQVVMQKKVSLKALNPNANTSEWTRYAIDLNDLMEQDAEAIYQLRLGFRPSYADFYCGSTSDEDDTGLTLNQSFNESGEITSIWDSYYGFDGYYDGFNWRDREDPCKPAYYSYENFIRRNVVASNLGIIAKSGADGSVKVAVTDLRTAEPVANVAMEFYDFQQQLIETISTDNNGFAETELGRVPFVVVANQGNRKGYLRMMDPNALSLSKFDVGGTVAQKGLKGFIYGDRGVWRPGDTLFLNFVLEDKAGKLPLNYPINFELLDARGQVQAKRTTSNNVQNVYPLAVNTDADAPTGNWTARVKAGGATFTKTLKVETVKPNRLKIKVDFGTEEFSSTEKQVNGDLQVNWLHGAPAQNLKAIIEMQLRSAGTKFEKYGQYIFDDPTRKISSNPQTIFEGNVDENGSALISAKLPHAKVAPGKLVAGFKTRAFEKGGDFSADNFSMTYSPFSSFVGVNIPVNKYNSKRVDIDKPGEMSFVLLDESGAPLANRNLKAELYRINWRWWWDGAEGQLSNYNSSENLRYKQEKTITTNSRGEANWTLTVNRWGRYLVRVCDEISGHCTGDKFYAGYPWYDDDSNNQEAAAMLAFSADKQKYKVGENVELRVPAGEEGRVLVSIENGSKVIESFWVQAKKGDNTINFKATEEMTPTIYANISLVQPHGQVKNDLPIRMYGVIPIQVEDPATRLQPEIKIAKELKPEQEFIVEVEEKNNKPMAYTIAVVDDGLLDLTRFKTPDPWNSFYAREALGVKTWDVYDQVLGAYGGELERVLSIGGDGAEVEKDGQKANRFKPVVMHLGPFEIGRGGKGTHTLKMPNYVGSVRAMVVASSNGAYGKAEQTIPVRKPLMVLATLPRVLGPTEKLTLPVNVFAMKDNVRDVTVTVEESSGLVRFPFGESQQITFNRVGDQIVNFDMEVAPQIGVAKFKITAKGGGETTTQEIEVDVRNPNPFVTNLQSKTLEAGQTWDANFEAVGMIGTNQATLEVSNIPPLDLADRLRYLIGYPHGCVEQTTSKALAQLYLSKLTDLTDQQKNEIPENINAAIKKLKNFQISEGGFSYWPGESYYSDWGSCYAGHFLLEAKNQGYAVPSAMLNRWKKHQAQLANSWSSGNNGRWYRVESRQLVQAYRLYGLALGGSPEMGAMNRLREMKDLTAVAKWRLAAAYALAGKNDVANQLINRLNTNIKPYREMSYSYGSNIRDEAMILETLVAMKNKDRGSQMVQDLARNMSQEKWMSTQTLAFGLMAVAKYTEGGGINNRLAFSHQIGNAAQANAGSNSPLMLIDVPVDGNNNKSISIKNTTGGTLFARLVSTGQPTIGDQTAAANHLKLNINYTNMKGGAIDITNIPQGTDFVANVTVVHDGTRSLNYDEMALTQVFPSGWEIHNSRMDAIEGAKSTDEPEYQDIRDDRVFTYFDINRNTSKTYRIQLNAAYQGRYYLPTVTCEAMYDNTISARQPGKWVEVVSGEVE